MVAQLGPPPVTIPSFTLDYGRWRKQRINNVSGKPENFRTSLRLGDPQNILVRRFAAHGRCVIIMTAAAVLVVCQSLNGH